MKGLLKFALLGAAIIALGVTNVVMFGQQVDISPISSGNAVPKNLDGQQVSDDETGIDHIEALTFVQTFSRPLFSTDRRKYQPPKPKPPPKPAKVAAAPKPKPAINPPGFRLIGVSMDGVSARALIIGGPGPDPQWVAEGEAIEGWVLEKVSEGAIRVSQAGTEFSIDLYPESR